MKKLTTLIVAVVALSMSALLFAGCSSNSTSSAASASSAATAADDKCAVATGKLIVGFDNQYPPYGFINDEGQEVGFDLDLAAEVAKRNGWEFEQKAINWDSKDAELASGTINCIWNGFTWNVDDRPDQYTWSNPYMNNEQVVVVKAGSDIKTEADLADKVVITQAGSAALSLLEGDKADLAATFKGGKVTTIADYVNAFEQLKTGAVEAIVCDLSVADYQMAAQAGEFENIISLSKEEYAVGFLKGDTDTAEAVNKTLSEMVADGTVAELAKKYEADGLNMANWILK